MVKFRVYYSSMFPWLRDIFSCWFFPYISMITWCIFRVDSSSIFPWLRDIFFVLILHLYFHDYMIYFSCWFFFYISMITWCISRVDSSSTFPWLRDIFFVLILPLYFHDYVMYFSCWFFFHISMITWYVFRVDSSFIFPWLRDVFFVLILRLYFHDYVMYIRELQMFASWRHFSNCSTKITRKCNPQDLASVRPGASSVAGNTPPYLTLLIAVWLERNEKPEDGWSLYSYAVGKKY